MRSLFVAGVVFAAAAWLTGCQYLPMAQSDAGWTTLLDGASARSVDNWDRIGDVNWRVEDGTIVGDKGKGGYLVSKNSYRDFALRAEFWADHSTNSGIFLRLSNPKDINTKNSYEVNIYDQNTNAALRTGGIPNFAPPLTAVSAGGKWNTFEITAKGTHIVVLLNGVKTVDSQLAQFTHGPVALQYNSTPGGAIKWRKVQIRPL